MKIAGKNEPFQNELFLVWERDFRDTNTADKKEYAACPCVLSFGHSLGRWEDAVQNFAQTETVKIPENRSATSQNLVDTGHTNGCREGRSAAIWFCEYYCSPLSFH